MTSRACTRPSRATPCASRGLCSQTAFQSPMSDQAKSAATTAARVVRSITAWSKLIFGAAAKLVAEAQRAEVVGALVDRAAHRRERRGACASISREAGVGTEAEHPGVPEAARGDQLGGAVRRRASRRNARPRWRRGRAARRARCSRRPVEGPVGRMPRTTIRPSVRQPGGGGRRAAEGRDVGDQVVRRHHEDDGLGIAPRGEAGGQRRRRPACRGPAARARSRSACRARPPGRRPGSATARR